MKTHKRRQFIIPDFRTLLEKQLRSPTLTRLGSFNRWITLDQPNRQLCLKIDVLLWKISMSMVKRFVERASDEKKN